MADLKEFVTLALVGENIGAPKGLQNAQQQGKKKRKKKRLGLKDGGWGPMLVRAGGGLGGRGRGHGERRNPSDDTVRITPLSVLIKRSRSRRCLLECNNGACHLKPHLARVFAVLVFRLPFIF